MVLMCKTIKLLGKNREKSMGTYAKMFSDQNMIWFINGKSDKLDLILIEHYFYHGHWFINCSEGILVVTLDFIAIHF